VRVLDASGKLVMECVIATQASTLREFLGGLRGSVRLTLVAPRESALLDKRRSEDSCAKRNIQRGQLTLHADPGSAMTSKPVALLKAGLGVTKTHSRPYVSDDNRYPESRFRSLKHRPESPTGSAAYETPALIARYFPRY